MHTLLPRSPVFRCCLGLAFMTVGGPALRAQFYTAVDLGTLGGFYSTAYDLNAAGTVVGKSNVTTDSAPYLAFSHSGGTMTSLGTLGGAGSDARGINTAGTIVGYSEPGGGGVHAFSYSGGTMTDLGTLGGFSSQANDINDAGVIVGSSQIAGGSSRAFSYSGGTMTNLGTLDGHTDSIAEAVNATGTVVGYSHGAVFSARHAFSYSSGTMTDLGTLGGTYSEALDINDAGTVVGYAQTAGGVQRAFRYSAGLMTDLGTLGGTSSYARGINTDGTIVGAAQDAGGTYRAFVYADGTMQNLNTLVSNAGGVTFGIAWAINDLGQIVADGSDGHAYLLTLNAIPEPSTYAAFAGMAALAFVAIRRRKGRRGGPFLAFSGSMLQSAAEIYPAPPHIRRSAE